MLVPASDVVSGIVVAGIDEVIVWDKVIVDSIGIFVDEIVGLLVDIIDPVVGLLVGIIDPVEGLLVGIIDPVVDWKGVVSPGVEAAGVLASVLSDFVELPKENPSVVFSISVASVGSLPP